MKSPNKTIQTKLVTQIEFFKNYSEHRKRIQLTQQRSPLEKSISYDHHKQMLHQYIKNRKQYTSNYNRRQSLRCHQMRDSKMLRNILDYDQKLFVFSFNKNIPTDTSLHHNSLVSTNKKNESIDSENLKLHFRITKAKSQYSHLFPYRSLMASTRNFYDDKESGSTRKQSLTDKKLNTEVSQLGQFSSEHTFKRTKTNRNQSDCNYKQGKESRYRDGGRDCKQMRSDLVRSQYYQANKKACERVRRQKLAEKLYQKKQRFQKSILGRIKTNF